MTTSLRWFARLVDQKGVGLAGVGVDLQVFDRTANGWVPVASAVSSVTGLVRGTGSLENDSPILAPGLRLVESGEAVVLSATPRLSTGRGSLLNVDFGELTRLPAQVRFVPPRAAVPSVTDDPFVVGALVGPAAAATEGADNAAALKAIRLQVHEEVTREYESRLAQAQKANEAMQAKAAEQARQLEAAHAEIARLSAAAIAPGGGADTIGIGVEVDVSAPVKVSDFASTIGTELGSAQEALRSTGYSLGAISLTAKTVVLADGTVTFPGKTELTGMPSRALSDLVLQFRPEMEPVPTGGVRVPDVKQLTESAARRILGSVGLVLEAHYGPREIAPACAPGQAMIQTPQAGEQVATGARVLVVFAQDAR